MFAKDGTRRCPGMKVFFIYSEKKAKHLQEKFVILDLSYSSTEVHDEINSEITIQKKNNTI